MEKIINKKEENEMRAYGGLSDIGHYAVMLNGDIHLTYRPNRMEYLISQGGERIIRSTTNGLEGKEGEAESTLEKVLKREAKARKFLNSLDADERYTVIRYIRNGFSFGDFKKNQERQ